MAHLLRKRRKQTKEENSEEKVKAGKAVKIMIDVAED